MTAEIAIMNKEGIAIAADSAVTLREERGQKIFTSANKIFALSKYHPAGIMIYGSANFMGGSWETIIKIYRSKLGEKEFDTLKEYANDFIDFLGRENQLFPESVQEKYVKETVYGYFSFIRNQINYRRKNYVDPVMKVVAMLPKDELAAMAESLVNLTSFKRKVSLQAETVAVPIDVAVISKGDGFIWIKRKHYFSGEMNPQFFANYYREAKNGEKN